ncbi:MAG: redox-sensing transcriptional repressor Rex [Bacteroides sp.]|nr:redox-sensing transcriptional repressor Rex [Bacillota bacterium]MCM1393576.1 redox-sensing transcriptional repressor Rex [[Eubacterium] siraeum]MCM1455005.1 redox-sensing transcriptional repressor Rex [Bacteroides sp.]
MQEQQISEMSKATLRRLPSYLRYLYKLDKSEVPTVSSTTIANGLGLNPVQVRKDIALVSSVAGKPKTGFVTKELIADLESYLGYKNSRDAVLVGVGGLGRAILGYDGFRNYGLNIVAAFDVNDGVINTEVNGKPVYHIDNLKNVVERFKIRLGIICVPSLSAQKVADGMVEAGIKAIWCFAPVHLNLPPEIAVKGEDLAASLALLSMQLKNQ